jgi:hypothetical protein
MSLLSEYIYDIKNLRAGGLQSDDEDISDRQYAFIFNGYRAKLVKQMVDKNQMLSNQFVQSLGKVKLVESTECCDGVCNLRTEKEIPATIASRMATNGFIYVGNYGGSLTMNETSFESKSWNQYAKYTGKKAKWYLKNGYIYIENATAMLTYIELRGIFEDPLTAEEFRTCECEDNDEACLEGFDFEYPMPLHFRDIIFKMIMESEFRMSVAIPADTSNDSADNN